MARQGKSSNEEVSFSDIMLANRYRKAQNVFLNRIDRLIDWHPIPTLIRLLSSFVPEGFCLPAQIYEADA